MNVHIGIDLGTTNCCMAWLVGDQVVVYLDEHQHSTMPSIVAEDASGSILVGWRARACINPRFRHGFAKRALGMDQEFPFSSGPVNAAGISAYLLRELKTRAEGALQSEVA